MPIVSRADAPSNREPPAAVQSVWNAGPFFDLVVLRILAKLDGPRSAADRCAAASAKRRVCRLSFWASCFKEKAIPTQGTSPRSVTIAALAAASLSLPLAADAQSTDPNIRAIQQGATVPAQPGASQDDPNINAITNGK